jgi:hypothetical protein
MKKRNGGARVEVEAAAAAQVERRCACAMLMYAWRQVLTTLAEAAERSSW